MRQEEKLKEKMGKRLPYRVPDGYFESLNSRIIDSLPVYPEKPSVEKLSVWQRIRPYVYLAAMFAGIWCMMQIFHRVSTANTPHEETALAYAVNDPYEVYYLENYGDDFEIEDEVATLYPSMDEFKKDFYAQQL